MTVRPRGWLTADVRGQERVGQYVDTLLLRLKVRLFFRPWRRFLRRWAGR